MICWHFKVHFRFNCTIIRSFAVESSRTNVHIVGAATVTTPKSNDNVETVTKTKTYQELSLEDLLALQGSIWYLDLYDLQISYNYLEKNAKTGMFLKFYQVFNPHLYRRYQIDSLWKQLQPVQNYTSTY